MKLFFFLISSLYILQSCSIEKQITKAAKNALLNEKPLEAAHVGISIFEPETGKYWFDHQGDKYFVPASNTKIPTCYAAMKYLGDSLIGIRYGITEENSCNQRLIVLQPSGDPTFLHKDYQQQPVYDFLKRNFHNSNIQVGWLDTIWRDRRWGSGWSWNDYEEPYMAERSSFPIYGNTIDISLNEVKDRKVEENDSLSKKINLFRTGVNYFDSIINDSPSLNISRQQFKVPEQRWTISRSIETNRFDITPSTRPFVQSTINFVTEGSATAVEILKKEFNNRICHVEINKDKARFEYSCGHCNFNGIRITGWQKIYSRPTDSMLKPMMQRSDNFFAEQSLLMVSNERLGLMNDARIIDTLLKTDFKDLPQKPRWVDGSGLSRFNLFTPQDFVVILSKMQKEFGMERIKDVFPTGGEGTITSYYKADSGYIFAKTGTLSGVVALSGYLITRKNKLLIFSILVNNHQASATDIRKAIEKFVHGIRVNY